MRRRRSVAVIAMLIGSAVAVAAMAQGEGGKILGVPPDKIKWGATPAGETGVRGATLTGTLDQPGFYTRRVHLSPDGMVPPHTHPDTRYVTVLSGALYVGQDETMDRSKAVRYPAGSYLVVPAGAVHYSWALDGEVEYQESGIGPTATRFLNK